MLFNHGQHFSSSSHFDKTMNLIEAIRLYCHIMQQTGGNIAGREASAKALSVKEVAKEVIDAISYCVSNDGQLITADGMKFAITELAAS